LNQAAYSHLARTAVQQTARRVKEMHSVIAGTSFGILRRVPLLSGPAGLVETVHDAIAAGVYAAIHHGSGGVLTATAVIEQRHSLPDKPPGRLASGVRGALNGVFGDHLADSKNPLATRMAIHIDGASLALDAESLRRAFPAPGKRICLFIHGLACDEFCWQPGRKASDSAGSFGDQLHAEFACTPLYLRYNSGLAISENGALLAALLEELLSAWPQADGELVIVGHSMGGLVALEACEQATAGARQWPRSTRMLICLGSPHLGSPLERLGQLANSALNASAITRPLGKIADARSQGIKDLREGPGRQRNSVASLAIAFRFLGASLSADAAHPLGRFIGDGLVPLSSALAHPIDGDVQTATLGQLGHMKLVSDPRVYRQIREWVADAYRESRS
jgi:pimeloyl-ACP methyl ester carboxylesterase